MQRGVPYAAQFSENSMRIGYLGVGNMGQPMAGKLLDAGHELWVYDVREDSMLPLIERQARCGASPRELAENCEALARFGDLMRQRIQEGDTPARKAWLSSLSNRIKVDEGAIRLFGRKDVLEQCVIAGAANGPGVRAFVPKWRSLGESNPSFQNENLTS
jgi:hypothetical protein